MSVIALIPAKGYSRRIPNKNIMDFCGKPLFLWSVDQANRSKLVDQVYVSTDSSDIHEICTYYRLLGGAKTIRRPSGLCTDTTTQEEVIAHAIEALQLKDDDIIVLLQPTSPLRLPRDIDRCIQAVQSSRGAAFTTILEPDIFLWSDQASAQTFDEYTRRLKMKYERETGSIYAFTVSNIKSKSRYGFQNRGLSLIPQFKWQGFEIDEPEDVEICEYFMKTKILKEGK